ncbi:SBBP repeat-containing protein [Roseimaritima ulvae]|uniref:Beta-propeller repeat protein n=1 Tax=Roseimaritima ulvae TaxID=980254 RepID=A0A5B9QZH8_9BACT|nr:SBBP repeat-containing protein [Roseimaritima ulvae]QEG39401.1 Beta-propeller repeat protein [Roseimaritima ulvae]
MPRSRFLLALTAFILVSHSLKGAEITFSTFLGGSEWEHARDVFVDDKRFVCVVGGTRSADFPTTENALQSKHDKTGNKIGSGGYCDAFVAKFDAEGKLVWSTLLGGPNYDRAYAVEVDGEGNVFVAGRAGPGFPVTKEAFQREKGKEREKGKGVLSGLCGGAVTISVLTDTNSCSNRHPRSRVSSTEKRGKGFYQGYHVPPGCSAPDNLPPGHPGEYCADMRPDPVMYPAANDDAGSTEEEGQSPL